MLAWPCSMRRSCGFQAVEVLVVGADPVSAAGRWGEGADPLALDGSGAGERSEADSVEAGQTLARADQQVAVGRVLDGVDVVVREAVLDLPHLLVVLGEAQAGVEGEAG